MQTVVTMTSWKGRIDFVSRSIYRFFKTQTKLPDIFYLWLSEEEFPNRENDLPKELLLIIKYFNVKLKWLPYNDRNFKRWYVYPTHYFDLVISIDDDQILDSTLVEEAEKHKNEKNIIYNIFKDLTFEYVFLPKKPYNYKLENLVSTKFVWLGCSIVCPETFPLEAISPENSEIRRKICKRCDESWLKPFSLMNDTKISYFNFKHKNDTKLPENGTWRKLMKRYNSFTFREYQLYICLKYFPKHYDKFKKIYPTYTTYYKEMLKIDTTTILKFLNNN